MPIFQVLVAATGGHHYDTTWRANDAVHAATRATEDVDGVVTHLLVRRLRDDDLEDTTTAA